MTPALEQIKALPELPVEEWNGPNGRLYSAEQMREYALQALRDEAGEAVACNCPSQQVCDKCCGAPAEAVWLMPVATQEPQNSRLLQYAWARSNLSSGQMAQAYDCIVSAAKQCGQVTTRPAPAAEAAPQGVDWNAIGREEVLPSAEAIGRAFLESIAGRQVGYSERRLLDRATALAATPPSAPAVVDLGENGVLLGATVAGNVILRAVSDEQFINCTLIGCGLEYRKALTTTDAPVPQEGVDGFDDWLAREYPLYSVDNIVTQRMRAAWDAALAAGALPQGMVLVPTHYAETALSAACLLEQRGDLEDAREAKALRKLAAMLAAAPAQGVR